MEKEIWEPIAGYDSSYEVSNLGRIRSLNFRNEGRVDIIKPSNVMGNIYVRLYKRKVANIVSLSKLVAENFVPNPNGYKNVYHVNRDRSDNRACNIEWSENKVFIKRK